MRVITGTARGHKLLAPEGYDTRPTTDKVKEAICSALQFDFPYTTVLDLFAGSGQMGIEALSRGAERAVFTDSDPKAIACIRPMCKLASLRSILRFSAPMHLAICSAARKNLTLHSLTRPITRAFSSRYSPF